jgi:hypothetical protein
MNGRLGRDLLSTFESYLPEVFLILKEIKYVTVG